MIEMIGFIASYVLTYSIGYLWALSPHRQTPWWYFFHWFILAAAVTCLAAVVADLGRFVV